MYRPKRCKSYWGAAVAVSSCSQALQDPPSTWRIASERPRRGGQSGLSADALEMAEEDEHVQRSAQA